MAGAGNLRANRTRGEEIVTCQRGLSADAPHSGTIMAIYFHEEDLPSLDLFAADAAIAVDTEAMGLIPGRDRLCLVQLADGHGDEHLVRFGPDSDYAAPNLKA